MKPEWLIRLEELFKGRDGPRNIAYAVFFVIYLIAGIVIYVLSSLFG